MEEEGKLQLYCVLVVVAAVVDVYEAGTVDQGVGGEGQAMDTKLCS